MANARKRATLVSAILAALLYSTILLAPAVGGLITAEQPAASR